LERPEELVPEEEAAALMPQVKIALNKGLVEIEDSLSKYTHAITSFFRSDLGASDQFEMGKLLKYAKRALSLSGSPQRAELLRSTISGMVDNLAAFLTYLKEKEPFTRIERTARDRLVVKLREISESLEAVEKEFREPVREPVPRLGRHERARATRRVQRKTAPKKRKILPEVAQERARKASAAAVAKRRRLAAERK